MELQYSQISQEAQYTQCNDTNNCIHVYTIVRMSHKNINSIQEMSNNKKLWTEDINKLFEDGIL